MEAAKNVTIQIMDTNPVALTDISPQFDISLMPSDEDGIVEYLTKLKWPVGLQKLLIEGVKMIPAKFFVCDDSGTMMFSDGHKVIEDGGSVKLVSCSRWSEMTESLRFHIDLAGAAKAPTEFRLLNGANAINMGIDKESDEVSRAALFNQLEMYVGASPTKKRTPLSYHVNQVVDRIKNIAPQLRKSGKKAALVILTDGEASDGEIMSTLRRLKDLPVWVVVRLCTDNHKMVDYWNNVDSQVALSMDVLDDPHGEAKEIFRWLTYGEPLHRLREFGTIAKEMDLIDEAPLTMDEMKTMICHILNAKPSDLPNPVTDWDGFYKTVSDLNDAELPVWNPMTNKLERWIDLKRLKVQYGKSGGCCSIA